MTDPNFDYTKNRGLSFRMTVREYQAITQAGDLPTHTILLRRLANTHLPHEPNSASPLYNPYVTIDYIENIVTQSDQVRGDLPTQGGRFAQGRRQPFAAHVTQIKRQASAGSTDRKHTMFRQNALVADPTKLNSVPATETLAYPFDWLVHPDRQIISPMELLQVSAYHPHELTQQFVISNGGTDSKFRHRADWFDEKQRLYRFFEMAETESRMSGVGGSVNEYVPGRINLNTIWDVETFSALCDAQGIRMTNAQVATMFAKMVSKRTPNQVPGPNDQPFRGAAEGMRPLTDGQLPGSGIKDTFLKDDLGTNTTTLRRMFGVPPMDPANETVFEKHPYRGAEMMTKIFSNTTTRSNVFAVWVTVGFFRVVDEKTRPVTLGAEIGRAENRHVRYRMFAIVDRTKIGAVSSFLTSFDTNEKVELTAAQMAAGITQPGLATVKLQATEGTRPAPSSNSRIPTGGFDWKIHPGQVVRISNTEVVTVRAVDHANKTITAFFTSEHKPSLFGAPTVSLNGIRAPGGILGHPGPQPDFDPRRFPDVVPYFTVIERIGG